MSERIGADLTAGRGRGDAVQQHNYYQKLQADLKDKAKLNKLIDEQQQAATKQVEKTQQNKDVQQNQRVNAHKDQVRIGSLDWKQNKNGDFDLNTEGPSPNTSVDLENNGQEVLRVLGHNIDFSERVPQLKQAFMQNVVQSKTSNFFLSKFAKFKVGLIGQILTTLGVSAEELQKLQKKAIEGASEENIKLMQENMYNMIITELVHGRNRYTKRTMQMFMETQKQLMAQMNLIGNINYWDEKRMLDERIRQYYRIKEEFLNERDALKYQLDFTIQEHQDG